MDHIRSNHIKDTTTLLLTDLSISDHIVIKMTQEQVNEKRNSLFLDYQLEDNQEGRAIVDGLFRQLATDEAENLLRTTELPLLLRRT